MTGPGLKDSDIELRPFAPADEPAMESMMAEPDVKKWWADADFDRDPSWVVEVEGEFAGWIQYEEESYEWYPSVALDITFTTPFHGRGYGRRVLRMVIEH